MKTIIKKFIVLISIFMCVQSVHINAQNVSILDHFNIAELNGALLLDWQIKQGKTCNGIKIYRSVNNSAFVQIGEIDGVCGSTTKPILYLFKDETPAYNQINTYRLDLGGFGNSETISAEIINLESPKYQIRPHPIVSSSKLLFNNPKSKDAIIFIFSMDGKQHKALKTNNDHVFIKADEFTNGLYFFQIILNNQPFVKGRLVIQ